MRKNNISNEDDNEEQSLINSIYYPSTLNYQKQTKLEKENSRKATEQNQPRRYDSFIDNFGNVHPISDLDKIIPEPSKSSNSTARKKTTKPTISKKGLPLFFDEQSDVENESVMDAVRRDLTESGYQTSDKLISDHIKNITSLLNKKDLQKLTEEEIDSLLNSIEYIDKNIEESKQSSIFGTLLMPILYWPQKLNNTIRKYSEIEKKLLGIADKVIKASESEKEVERIFNANCNNPDLIASFIKHQVCKIDSDFITNFSFNQSHGEEALKELANNIIQTTESENRLSAMNMVVERIALEIMTGNGELNDLPEKGKKVVVRSLLQLPKGQKITEIIPKMLNSATSQIEVWAIIALALELDLFTKSESNIGLFPQINQRFANGTFENLFLKRLAVSSMISPGIFVHKVFHNLVTGMLIDVVNAALTNKTHNPTINEDLAKGSHAKKIASIEEIDKQIAFASEKFEEIKALAGVQDSDLSKMEYITDDTLKSGILDILKNISNTDRDRIAYNVAKAIHKQENGAANFVIDEIGHNIYKKIPNIIEGFDEFFFNYSDILAEEILKVSAVSSLSKNQLTMLVFLSLAGLSAGITSGVRNYRKLNKNKKENVAIMTTIDDRSARKRIIDAAVKNFINVKQVLVSQILKGEMLTDTAARIIQRCLPIDILFPALSINTGGHEASGTSAAIIRSILGAMIKNEIKEILDKLLSEKIERPVINFINPEASNSGTIKDKYNQLRKAYENLKMMHEKNLAFLKVLTPDGSTYNEAKKYIKKTGEKQNIEKNAKAKRDLQKTLNNTKYQAILMSNMTTQLEGFEKAINSIEHDIDNLSEFMGVERLNLKEQIEALEAKINEQTKIIADMSILSDKKIQYTQNVKVSLKTDDLQDLIGNRMHYNDRDMVTIGGELEIGLWKEKVKQFSKDFRNSSFGQHTTIMPRNTYTNLINREKLLIDQYKSLAAEHPSRSKEITKFYRKYNPNFKSNRQ